MVTIRLKDARTGEWATYPVAFFDYDQFVADGRTPSLDIKDSSNPYGGYIGDYGRYLNANYDQLTDHEKGVFILGTPSFQTADRYFDDAVKPDGTLYKQSGEISEVQQTRLYIPDADDIYATMFIPVLSDSPAVESGGDRNIYGEKWLCHTGVSGWSLDGYHVPSAMIYNSDGTIPEDTEYFASDEVSRLFVTDRGIYFGINHSVTKNKYARASVGCKQSNSDLGNTTESINNVGWDYQTGNGDRIIATTSGGVYSSQIAEYGPIDDIYGHIKPAEYLTVQMVATKRYNITYIGCAAISWKENALGNLIPDRASVKFLPSWVFGAISGDFDPYEPPVSTDIPITPPSWTNGTWSISQSNAGTASIPGKSPLANIGVADAGIHVYAINDLAVAKILDEAWWEMNEKESTSFYSGIISCGFIPKLFVDTAKAGVTSSTKIYVGGYTVDGLPQNSTYLINNNIFVQKSNVFYANIPRVYGDYFDYEPHTSVSITIPFCGTMQIPASCCVGGSIAVDMNCNLTNGDVVATINTVSDPVITKGLTPSDTVNDGEPLRRTFFMRGNCMCRFPLTGTSDGTGQYMSSMMQVVGGLVNTGISAASGNIGGVISGVSSVASGVYGASNARYQQVVGGAPVGGVSLIDNKKIVVSITRPAPFETNIYSEYFPYMSYQHTTLNAVKGKSSEGVYILDKYSRVTVSSIEFEDNGMTAAEIESISETLRGGVLV